MLGVHTGVRLSKGEQIVHPPRIRRAPKESENERKMRALLNNIDSYDGNITYVALFEFDDSS